jgi:hypothetical protein
MIILKGGGGVGTRSPPGAVMGGNCNGQSSLGAGAVLGRRDGGGKTRPRLAPLPCVNTLLLFYFLGTQEYFTSIIGRYTYLYSPLKIS